MGQGFGHGQLRGPASGPVIVLQLVSARARAALESSLWRIPFQACLRLLAGAVFQRTEFFSGCWPAGTLSSLPRGCLHRAAQKAEAASSLSKQRQGESVSGTETTVFKIKSQKGYPTTSTILYLLGVFTTPTLERRCHPGLQ